MFNDKMAGERQSPDMMKAFRRSVTASRDIKPNIPIGIGDIKYVRPDMAWNQRSWPFVR